MVSRIIHGSQPDDLENALDESYRKRGDSSDSCSPSGLVSVSCHTSYTFNAKEMNLATWNALEQRVSPVMLHIVKNGISVWASWSATPGYLVAKEMDGGFVTLLAKQRL